jgi:PEGA domain/Tetratricopeptide repeat
MHRQLRLMASFLPFSLAVASPAAAQDRPALFPERTTEARAHFGRAATLYLEGDYAAALIEFKRAYDASPTWQVLFNIGQCYFELRDYANALTTLQRFASEGGDRIGKDDRATLDAELPDLANRVARVTVSSNLDGATVSVDDQVVGTTPLTNPLLVSIGMRRIAAAHEGRASVQQRLAVGAGDTAAVRLDFAPVDLPAVPSPASRATLIERPKAPHGPNSAPAYVSFVVAAGGVAVGSIFGSLAIGDKSNLDRVCMPSGACPASVESSIQALSRDSTVSTVGFGVGLAGLTAGVLLWLAARPTPATAASLRLSPGGIAGRF